MRLGGKGGGGLTGGGSGWGWGRGGYFGVDGDAVGRDLECEEVECEGDE